MVGVGGCSWVMPEQTMTLAAITFSEVMLTLHILAVVIAFGGALAYPIWFRMIRTGTPEQAGVLPRASSPRKRARASPR